VGGFAKTTYRSGQFLHSILEELWKLLEYKGKEG